MLPFFGFENKGLERCSVLSLYSRCMELKGMGRKEVNFSLQFTGPHLKRTSSRQSYLKCFIYTWRLNYC